MRAAIEAVLDPEFRARPADLRIVLAIIHEVGSWSRVEDEIALSQIARRAGVSLRTLYRALARLVPDVITYQPGGSPLGESRRRSRVGLPQPVTNERHRSAGMTNDTLHVTGDTVEPMTSTATTDAIAREQPVTSGVSHTEKNAEKAEEECAQAAGETSTMDLVTTNGSRSGHGASLVAQRVFEAIQDGRRSWDLFEIATSVWEDLAEPTLLRPRIAFAIDYCRALGADDVDGARIGLLVKRHGKAALYGLDEALARALVGDSLYRYADKCARSAVERLRSWDP